MIAPKPHVLASCVDGLHYCYLKDLRELEVVSERPGNVEYRAVWAHLYVVFSSSGVRGQDIFGFEAES